MNFFNKIIIKGRVLELHPKIFEGKLADLKMFDTDFVQSLRRRLIKSSVKQINIESILAQRGVPFELLIGDDCSLDDTWSRVRSYTADPRVRAWRFRVRRGSSAVWNRLIQRAQGSFLSICDADDRMLPGNLRTLSRLLDRRGSVGVACAEWRYIDRSGARLPGRRRALSADRHWDLLRMGATHGGSMIRRSIMRAVGGYRNSLSYADAYDLFLRLAERTEIKTLPGKALYEYRLRSYPSGYLRYRKRLEHLAVRDAILRRYGVRVRW